MLKISDLTFSYPERPVLKDFSLEIPMKGFTALNGPSGCGKTTLLRLIAGLEQPCHGQITGVSPQETTMLFQEDRLLPWRSVREHLTDGLPRGASLLRIKEEPVLDDGSDGVDDWLAFAELENEADTYPDQLSGGMARRLALARCCISCMTHHGGLLLLDEPFTGVDKERRARLIGRVKSLGIPAILATHEQDVLDACDRVISLDGPPLRILWRGKDF